MVDRRAAVVRGTFRNGSGHFFENVPRFGRRGFDAGKDVEFARRSAGRQG